MKQKLFSTLFLSLFLALCQPNFLADGSSMYSALPRGAKVRLGDFRGNKSNKIAFAPSPDGSRLAVVNPPTDPGYVVDSMLEIRLYDVATAVEIARLRGHTGPVTAVAFSADSTVLASSSVDKTVRLWDAQTGEHLATLEGHKDSVNAIAFSADGTTLVSGSSDKTVRLWDATNAGAVQPKFILSGHAEAVHSVGFAAHGEILVSVSSKRFGLWKAHTGEQIAMSPEHLHGISNIAFSPNGATLASSAVRRILSDEHLDSVTDVASSAEWEKDWSIRLWDIHTGQPKSVLFVENTGDAYSFAFAPDGTTLAIGRADGTIQLWHTGTGKILSTLTPPEEPVYREEVPVSALAFSTDGKLLAGGDSNSIQVWDTHLCQRKATFFERIITSLAFVPVFSREGATVASASRSGTVVLWKPISVVEPDIIARITPSRRVSPAIGEQLTFNIEIVGGKNVAGYQLTVEFDATALRYISSTNGDYLSGDTYRMPPVIDENQVTFASSSFTENRNGNGILATVTFEGVALKTSTLNLVNVILSDSGGHRSRPTVENAQLVEP